MSDLKNKVAFITGASSGLGQATAVAMAKQGAHICLAGRNTAGLESTLNSIEELGVKNHIEKFDITDKEKCVIAIENCIAEFGKLDILVNNAGEHKMRHFKDISDEQWLSDININLSGAFYLSQAAMPHILKVKGNIINIGSLASIEGQPYSAGYCAAKHGLMGLTKALAKEFINSDIRINAVCPGGMNTPQLENFKMPDDADVELVMSVGTNRGLMSPESVAETICFLASERAKSIHGAILNVDLGKTIG